eukprot:11040481-Lingulodinium_polyedra.AAC.1
MTLRSHLAATPRRPFTALCRRARDRPGRRWHGRAAGPGARVDGRRGADRRGPVALVAGGAPR